MAFDREKYSDLFHLYNLLNTPSLYTLANRRGEIRILLRKLGRYEPESFEQLITEPLVTDNTLKALERALVRGIDYTTFSKVDDHKLWSLAVEHGSEKAIDFTISRFGYQDTLKDVFFGLARGGHWELIRKYTVEYLEDSADNVFDVNFKIRKYTILGALSGGHDRPAKIYLLKLVAEHDQDEVEPALKEIARMAAKDDNIEFLRFMTDNPKIPKDFLPSRELERIVKDSGEQEMLEWFEDARGKYKL